MSECELEEAVDGYDVDHEWIDTDTVIFTIELEDGSRVRETFTFESGEVVGDE